jgi:hypothetical protein
MYVGNENTATQTLITYVGPASAKDTGYLAATILFAESFDLSALPKSLRARRMMKVVCTPTSANEKNEEGIKRLRRILRALEGTPVKVIMPYGNSISEEDFFARAA